MKSSTVLLRTSSELKLTFLLLLVLGVTHAGFGQQNLSLSLGSRAFRQPADTKAVWVTAFSTFDFSGSLGGITYFDMEIPPPEDPAPAIQPAPTPIPYTPPAPASAPAYKDNDSLFWTGFGFLIGGLVLLAVGIPNLDSDGGPVVAGTLCTSFGGGFSLSGLIMMLCDID